MIFQYLQSQELHKKLEPDPKLQEMVSRIDDKFLD